MDTEVNKAELISPELVFLILFSKWKKEKTIIIRFIFADFYALILNANSFILLV